MSLTEQAKRQLLAAQHAACCQAVCQAAVLCLSAAPVPGRQLLKVRCTSRAAAEQCRQLFAGCQPADPTQQDAPAAGHWLVTVEAALPGLLACGWDQKQPLADFFAGQPRPSTRVLGRNCCARALFAAAFLAAGHVTAGQKGYHLQISLPHARMARTLFRQLQRFGITPHLTEQANRTRLYIKQADSIAEFLSLCGAHTARMELEQLMATRDLRGQIQRRNNFDDANLKKVSNSSAQQVLALEKLQRAGVRLPEALQQAALARLENPADSLEELAARLKLSKSAVNHRLRRLMALAARVKE